MPSLSLSLLLLFSPLLLAAQPPLSLSTDEGKSWTDLTNGLPEDVQPRSIEDRAGTLYLSTFRYGLFRMDRDDCIWQPLGTGLPLGESFFPTALGIQDSVLVLGNYWDGIHRSTDGGAHWQPASTDLSAVIGDFLFLGDTLLAATRDGLYQSLDQGDHWTARGTDRTGLNALAVHRGRIVVASQNGAGVLTGEDISWSALRSEWAILQLFTGGEYVYAANHFGETYRSRTGGEWTAASWPGSTQSEQVTPTSRGWVMATGVGCRTER